MTGRTLSQQAGLAVDSSTRHRPQSWVTSNPDRIKKPRNQGTIIMIIIIMVAFLEYLKRKRWRWTGHVLRQQTTALTRIALRWTSDGQRKRNLEENSREGDEGKGLDMGPSEACLS